MTIFIIYSEWIQNIKIYKNSLKPQMNVLTNIVVITKDVKRILEIIILTFSLRMMNIYI